MIYIEIAHTSHEWFLNYVIPTPVDAVTRSGQAKNVQECINKLRTYPSEVKHKVSRVGPGAYHGALGDIEKCT